MPYLATYIKWFTKRSYWLILSFLFNPCFAQTSKVNEVQLKLKQTQPDTTRLRLLQQLTEAYTQVDPVKKFYYANECKALAEKLHDEQSIATAYISMGISYGVRSKLDSALYYFTLAYNQSEKCNYDLGMGKSLSDIGFVYDRLDNKQEAIKSYFKALVILKRTHFLRGINQCLTNIGSIYYDLNQYKLAQTYFTQCLKSYTDSHDEAGMGYALFTTGNCYQALGQDEQAKENFTKSLAIRTKLGDMNGIGLVRKGLGKVYLHQKQYGLALSNLDTALKYIRTLQDKYEESSVMLDKTDVYLAMHNYDKAKTYALQCLANGAIIKSKNLTSLSLERLVDIYKGKHELAKAFDYQSQYIAVEDSMLIEKAVKDVTLTEFSRVRTENAALSQKNQIITSKNTDYLQQLNKYSDTILIIAIVLGSVTLLLLVLYRRNLEKQATNKLLIKQKEEIAAINQELETLNEEVNAQMELTNVQNIELERLNGIKNKFFSIISHDLRGPISTLQTLFNFYRGGDLNKDELNSFLDTLEDNLLSTGTFLDNLLEWSKSQMEGIIVQPVNFNINDCISTNITLFAIKAASKKLKVHNLSHQPVLVNADRNMIDLVIRNLLSNSMKFCNPGDEITFDVQSNNNTVTIAIADTGPGIDEKDSEKLFSLEHTMSIGTQGEKGNRLGLILCRDMLIQNKGSISFETKQGEGTTFWITIPAANK